MSLLFLAHSSALKLRSLPDSHGPVWPILSYLLAEGVKRKDGSEKTIVIAFRKLAGELVWACCVWRLSVCVDLMRVDVCHLLQPVVEEMAIDVCEVSIPHVPSSPYPSIPPPLLLLSLSPSPPSPPQPSSSEQSVQTKRLFCSFIGKLFLAASYSQNKELSPCLITQLFQPPSAMQQSWDML